MNRVYLRLRTTPLTALICLWWATTLGATETSNGLAPEITDLNAEDVSYALEHKLPYLAEPYLSDRPRDMGDGIPVGTLGVDGGERETVLAFARELAQPAEDEKAGKIDSLLVCYQGKLILECYYRRGRINYPHYQMSLAKSYTALALGRAMQLGHLTMADLDKPVITFLEDLDPGKLVAGADAITLHQAMQMRSGIRVDPKQAQDLRKTPALLKGQGQIQAYLQYSEPIPPAPRPFKYQASDPTLAMQVLAAIVPGSAQDFLRDEFFKPLGITNYHWQDDLSGLPKAAAGCSLRSRDMLKIGRLLMNGGIWRDQRLIPQGFVERALSPLVQTYGATHYGYFWWMQDYEIGGKTYHCKQGRGAGGQFLFMFPTLDLIAVITAHNKGMGNMLLALPHRLVPAFVP